MSRSTGRANLLAVVALGAFAPHLHAFTVVNTTWIGPASGGWLTSSNWSGGAVPASNFQFGYVPTVDGNAGQATTASIPSGTSLGLYGLNIGANDTVRIENNSFLGILEFNNGATPLTVNNAGTLVLAGTTAFTELGVQNPWTLTGGGTLVMGGPIGNRIWNPNQPGSPRLTNVNNLIIGSGTIGVGGTGMVLTNQGTITASAGTLNMSLGRGANFNQAFIRAGNAGTLLLRNTTLDNTGGQLIADAGGVIYFDGVTITGGSVAGVGVSRLGNVAGGASTNNLTSFINGGTLELLGNCTTNFGSFSNAAYLKILPGSRAVATGTITNTGFITFEQGPDIGAGGAQLLLNGNVTLAGGGLGQVTTNLASGFLLATIQRTSLADTLTNYNIVSGRMFVETHIDNYGVFDSGGNGQGMLLGSSVAANPTNTINRPGGVIRASANSQLVLAINSTVTNQGTMIVQNGGSLVINTGASASGNGVANEGWMITIGSMAINSVTGTSGSLDFRGGATPSTLGLLRQRQLRMESGTLRILVDGTTAATARVNTLTFVGGASPVAALDLTNNYMVVDYTGASPQTTIRSLLSAGFNGGSWTGNGIRSSSAATPTFADGIGYAEAAALFGTFPAVFAGQSVDNTSVLMRYTLYGDANLDGTVSIADFSQLASNYNQPGVWSAGDFNYDGTIGIGDFSFLASNYNKSVPPVNPAPLPDARTVPEPTSIAAALLVGLATRRRRQA